MLDDYIDVATRIAKLKELFPNARLQPANPAEPFTIREIAGVTYIVYIAACYTGPDDVLPGIGCAWEKVPGRGMIAGSELMVAETSAWGRAIVAATMLATKNIASADEVNAAKERAKSIHEAYDPWSKPQQEIEATSPGVLMHDDNGEGRGYAPSPTDGVSVMTCRHGEMEYKGGGTNPKTGKKLPRWSCQSPDRQDQCPAVW